MKRGLIYIKVQGMDSYLVNECFQLKDKYLFFIHWGTRSLVSLNLRLVLLPFEPFDTYKNNCEITQGAVARVEQSLIHYMLNLNCIIHVISVAFL